MAACVAAGTACQSGHVASAGPAPLQRGGGYAAYCGGSPGCPVGSVPGRLRRALHLPRVSAGRPCPVELPGRRRTEGLSAMLGGGPVYAISVGRFARTGVLPFRLAPNGWAAQKLLWAVKPPYRGPVLVRGRPLDGSGRVGFGTSPTPYAELDLPPGRGSPSLGGWRAYPSDVRVRRPGCYAWQIDGTTFSASIVFRAVVSPR